MLSNDSAPTNLLAEATKAANIVSITPSIMQVAGL